MIAIIGAMPEEIAAILKISQATEEITIKKKVMYKAKIFKNDVVVALSGVGKVEAAYTCQLLINEFDIDLIINIGSAGGLQPGQRIGDVVIASECQYHDFIIHQDDPLEGLERFDFRTDSRLVKIMKDSLDDLKIRNWIGLVVSGDQFISTKEQSQYIINRFPYAICSEMEATAIAHVCTLEEKPYVIIRSLSDIALKQGNEIDFETYLPLASASSTNACLLFLTKYNQLYHNEK